MDGAIGQKRDGVGKRRVNGVRPVNVIQGTGIGAIK